MCAVPLSALSNTCDVAAQDLQWAVCSMGSRGVLLASRPPDPARPARQPAPARPALTNSSSWEQLSRGPDPVHRAVTCYTPSPHQLHIRTCNLETLISVRKERFIQS